MRSKTLNFAAISVCLVLLFALCTNFVQAKSLAEAVVVAPVALQDLPKEGQETYLLIRQGGPFRYEKDGVVFGNREWQLKAVVATV
jgi:ribonuclease T1